MKDLKFLLAFVIIILLHPGLVIGQTQIPEGPVEGIWSKENGPYLINGDITIPANSVLEIQPGTVTRFTGHYALNVQGSLIAEGSENDLILFTIQDTSGFHKNDRIEGGWNGIHFIDIDEDQDSSALIYCKLEFAKAVGAPPLDNSGGAIHVSNFDKLLISHCILENNMAGGSDSPAGGAMFLFNADIQFRNNRVSNNRAGSGGGIRIIDSCPQFMNNLIQFNEADEGGGMAIGGSCPGFSGDQIMNNKATYLGGGIFMNDALAPVTFKEVLWKSNEANWGGGMGLGYSNVILTDCVLEDNYATWLGAAIAADYSTVTIANSSFIRDTTGDSGGAIHIDRSALRVSESEFYDNYSVNGGCINSVFGDVELSVTTLEGNVAMNDGGALKIYNSDLLVHDCHVENNMASNLGGAISFYVDSVEYNGPYEVDIARSSISYNRSLNNVGGADFNLIDPGLDLLFTMEQVTIDSNEAEINSGLRLINAENFIISNSVISNNISNIRTSGLIFNACSGTIENTLFYGNEAGSGTSGCGVNNYSEIDLVNNLFYNNTGGGISGLHVRRGSQAYVTNCILWKNHPNQISLTGGGVTDGSDVYINHSLLQDGMDSIQVDETSRITWGAGNINEDPGFVDEENLEFYLEDNSPCLGQGIEMITIDDHMIMVPEIDFDGNPRPNPAGSNPDIGPFESSLSQSTYTHDEINFINSILIYPNPVKNKLELEITLNKPCLFKASVFNIYGHKLSEIEAQRLAPGKQTLKWLTGDMPAGNYIISLYFNDLKISRQVLLVH